MKRAHTAIMDDESYNLSLLPKDILVQLIRIVVNDSMDIKDILAPCIHVFVLKFVCKTFYQSCHFYMCSEYPNPNNDWSWLKMYKPLGPDKYWDYDDVRNESVCSVCSFIRSYENPNQLDEDNSNHEIQHEAAILIRKQNRSPVVYWFLDLYVDYVRTVKSRDSFELYDNWENVVNGLKSKRDEYKKEEDEDDSSKFNDLPPWIRILCLVHYHQDKSIPGALLVNLLRTCDSKKYGLMMICITNWVLSNTNNSDSTLDEGSMYECGVEPAIAQENIPLLDIIFRGIYDIQALKRHIKNIDFGTRCQSLYGQSTISCRGESREDLIDLDFCCDIPFSLLDLVLTNTKEPKSSKVVQWMIEKGFTHPTFCTNKEIVIYLASVFKEGQEPFKEEEEE
jgi:hypothetical protein